MVNFILCVFERERERGREKTTVSLHLWVSAWVFSGSHPVPRHPQPVTEHHDGTGLTNFWCLCRWPLYQCSLWAGRDCLRAILHSGVLPPSFPLTFHRCQPYFSVWGLSVTTLHPFRVISFIGNVPSKSLTRLHLSCHLLPKESTCHKSVKLHTDNFSPTPCACILRVQNTTWGSTPGSQCDSPRQH